METNGASEVTTSHVDVTEDSETTVEIKIKTLDSHTYTLRVNKCVPVLMLKEQIATVTGVVSEQQRLICRGKVLKDDELLSAYHVEDGHTLHLVVRQPHQSSSSPPTGHVGSEGASANPAANSSSSIAHNRGSHVARSIVFEAVNIDQGDNRTSHLSRFISSILSSIGTTNTAFQNPRNDLRETGGRTSGDTGLPDPVQSNPNPSSSRVEVDSQQSPLRFQSVFPLGSQQPIVIPDSLTTMNQYLGVIRDDFRREGISTNGREQTNDAAAAGMNSIDVQNHDFLSPPPRQGGLPSPASLAEIVLSTRQLLMDQAGGCLSQLAGHLEDHVSVTDPLTRMDLQSSAIRSGVILRNLGSLLLELGRTTMTLRMGQTPLEAVVNAGPAVFISASGPNPLMVQPVPFFPGSSFGGTPFGEPPASAFIPRNVDIRVRTDPTRNPSTANSVNQAFSGISSTTSFAGESGVRVVPIRTVVAVPTGHSPSDSSGSAVGVIYPLLARIQHVNSANANNARGSRASNEPNQSHPNINQPNLESAMQNQSPANSAPVVSWINPSANELPSYQGSSPVSIASQQAPPASSSESNTQAHVEPQVGQGPMSQFLNRVDEWLRTALLSGEQVQGGGTSHQESVTGSAAVQNQTGTARNTETQEASRVGNDDGVFFSSLVRELMPFLSQRTTVPGGSASNDGSTAQTASHHLNDSSSSQHHRDPPEAPSPKRPRRNSE
ncbi:ubiquitin-like domain-containing protein CIP73 isoform X2 [Phoenix dactylifera]|uniref:Ubiquitin-like domain-containing protein CIP73 isoform X2 n=1 Tax=Phoenix dactylifera TaxID=42345 RepID=A0A8B7MVN6_PHODC|nr:ubiquitin-like domain-containing protein CIP73 isoform X2 [Phoenix dactylifera]